MHAAAPRWIVLALLATGLAPAAATAADVWASADGRSALELRGFYKTLFVGLRVPDGLADGTGALAAVVDQTRAGLPSDEAALFPAFAGVPRYGFTTSHTARAWGRFIWRERLELQAGWQVAATVASAPAFFGGTGFGSSIPVTASQRASRRLWDFDPVLTSTDGFLLQHNLDLLAFKVRLPRTDVTVGRQVLSWGSGRLWNPTDLLSSFAPADIDREVRHGVDALRVSVSLAKAAQLELLWLPQLEGRDHGGVARGQFNVRGWDFAASAAKYVRDAVFGLDATGDIGKLGVHAEIAWTVAFDRDPITGTRDQFPRAVAGVDWRPVEKLVLTGEYYYNGWGATKPSGYLAVLQSPREARGEIFGAGRHYLGLVARWQATELLSVQGLVIGNLADPSAMLVPALEYWAAQNVLIRVGGYVPAGRWPDASGLRALTPTDVLLQTDAWRRASGSLGLRSEFGSSPFGLFVQVGVYTP